MRRDIAIVPTLSVIVGTLAKFDSSKTEKELNHGPAIYEKYDT